MYALISQAVGASMIVVCFYLLYARKLAVDKILGYPTLEAPALAVEIRNVLKISSNSSGIALFVIGSILVAIPAVIRRPEIPNPPPPWIVNGQVRKQSAVDHAGVYVIPRPPVTSNPAGGFQVKVLERDDGKPEGLYLTAENFLPLEITNYDDYGSDIKGRVMTLKKPISLFLIPPTYTQLPHLEQAPSLPEEILTRYEGGRAKRW